MESNYKNVKGKWEFGKKEKQFIDYCIAHNYEITECKQYISKTRWQFKINEDITEKWETMNDTFKFDEKQLDNFIKIKLQLEELKKQIT